MLTYIENFPAGIRPMLETAAVINQGWTKMAVALAGDWSRAQQELGMRLWMSFFAPPASPAAPAAPAPAQPATSPETMIAHLAASDAPDAEAAEVAQQGGGDGVDGDIDEVRDATSDDIAAEINREVEEEAPFLPLPEVADDGMTQEQQQH